MKVELLEITPGAEKLIEKAGRTCYDSGGKIKPGSHRRFIRNLIKAGHLSVLEHALATFGLSGVSRSLTHQLVRHRLCSFSQRSQRYVKEDDFGWVMPPSVAENKKAAGEYASCMRSIEETYGKLLGEKIPPEDARFLLPNACRSTIVFSANFRQLRHMIKLRGSPRAQWEIREAFIKITELLKKESPSCFFDFEIDKKKRIISVRD